MNCFQLFSQIPIWKTLLRTPWQKTFSFLIPSLTISDLNWGLSLFYMLKLYHFLQKRLRYKLKPKLLNQWNVYFSIDFKDPLPPVSWNVYILIVMRILKFPLLFISILIQFVYHKSARRSMNNKNLHKYFPVAACQISICKQSISLKQWKIRNKCTQKGHN